MDKRGYLLPPVANPDLPDQLEKGGDSFWIHEKQQAGKKIKEKEKEKETEKKKKKKKIKETTKHETNDNEENEDSSEEEEEEEEIRVIEDENDLFWGHVIDAALAAGHAKLKKATASKQKSNDPYASSSNEEKNENCSDSTVNLRTKVDELLQQVD